MDGPAGFDEGSASPHNSKTIHHFLGTLCTASKISCADVSKMHAEFTCATCTRNIQAQVDRVFSSAAKLLGTGPNLLNAGEVAAEYTQNYARAAAQDKKWIPAGKGCAFSAVAATVPLFAMLRVVRFIFSKMTSGAAFTAENLPSHMFVHLEQTLLLIIWSERRRGVPYGKLWPAWDAVLNLRYSSSPMLRITRELLWETAVQSRRAHVPHYRQLMCLVQEVFMIFLYHFLAVPECEACERRAAQH